MGWKYTDSPLVTYTNLTNNMTTYRTHDIDTITPHMIVGQWTAKQGADYFAETDRQVSANYVVGRDGSIALCVHEKDRSWCTSSPANDHRAVTIEIASDIKEPYAITIHAYHALVDLMADIAVRNGLAPLKFKNNKELIGQPEEQNITIHKWFSATNCPGTYILHMLNKIVEDANRIIGKEAQTSSQLLPYRIRFTKDIDIYKKPTRESSITHKALPGVYTAIAKSGDWLQLKSGVGWVELNSNTDIIKEV